VVAVPARRAEDDGGSDPARARRRRIVEAKSRLRALRVELDVLTHRVGSRVELKDVDFDCLDVITQYGPITPTAVARRVGVHVATMTGILGRLEKGGWIVRDPVQTDRRAVLVRGVPDRQRDIFRLYAGMNAALDEIFDHYSDDEMDLIVDFLDRCTQAGQSAAERLANGDD
jgi:DNA-binding MarR family transcriptional regulator